MKRKKIILFLITGTLSLCVICLAGAALLTNQWNRQSYHVYCELLTPGISLSEAEKRLSSVGPYSISVDSDYEDDYYYYVSFQDTMTSISVGYMLLVFDKDDRLVGAFRNTSLSDWSEADCQYNK
jgi:hypothetical protein